MIAMDNQILPNNTDTNELIARSKRLCERSEKIRAAGETLLLRCDRAHARSDTALAVSKILHTPNSEKIIKRCSCGAVYKPSNWFKLVLIDYQYDVPGFQGEMRNCSVCNSTLFFVSSRKPRT